MDVGYGSLWELRRIRTNPIDFLQRLAVSGDVVEFPLRDQRTFLVNDPQVIEQVLVTEERRFVKPPALHRATRLLGQGLLTAAEPLHTARRRVAQPAFHRDRYDGYGRVMSARAARLRDEWRDGQAMDVYAAMSALTLSIVGETLFGADLIEHSEVLRRVVARAVESFDPLVALVAPMRRLRPERAQLDAIVEALIEQRLPQVGDGRTLLDLLMAAAPDSTREQLHDDVLTLLLAGFDTISNALTFTWAFLAGHPSVDDALSRELAQLPHDRLPAMNDLSALPYVKAVFAESLRLRPPAWIIARQAVEALALGVGEIPAGALVLMSPYLTQRDPRYFPEPLAFMPDRWLASAGVSPRPRFSYFPFGAGRRSCIGESFALMEGALVLATLAQRWRLRLVDSSAAVDARITLRPRGPVMMIPEARA